MLSQDDLLRLEKLRIQRFTTLLNLDSVFTHIDLQQRVFIHCSDLSHAELLLDTLEQIQVLTRLILGLDYLFICCAGKVLWEGSIEAVGLESCLSDSPEDKRMVATLDKGRVESIAVTEFQGAIAPDLASTADTAIENFLNSNEAEEFAKRIAVERVNYWRSRLAEPPSNGRVATVEPPAVPATPEPAAETSAAPMQMRLPRGFKSKVSNRYKVTMDALIPGKERTAYLEQIAQETEGGKDWLSKVAGAIAAKYSKDQSKVYAALLSEARKMLKEQAATA